mmetsp:Transcript_5897/g.17721  ORF Transcript_5897/g.17721 Transcript_5897/m.17721 type:complete len:251 (+) Transcript_5897:121-873(+)
MSAQKSELATSKLICEGWTTLATLCPVCHRPLLRSGEQLYCAQCDMPVRLEERVREEDTRTFQGGTAMASANVNGNTPRSSRSRSDEAAQLMGPLLLKGWAMLDEVCPVNECAVPIMRSRSGEKICVIHGSPTEQAQAGRGPVPTAPEAEDRGEDRDVSMQGGRASEPGRESGRAVMNARVSAPHTAAARSGDETESRERTTLVRTIDRLIREMDSCGSPRTISELAVAIKSCCEALSALDQTSPFNSTR